MKLEVGKIYQNGEGVRFLIVPQDHPKLRSFMKEHISEGKFIGFVLGTFDKEHPDWDYWREDGRIDDSDEEDDLERRNLVKELRILNV